jgi:hypothetical protein
MQNNNLLLFCLQFVIKYHFSSSRTFIMSPTLNYFLLCTLIITQPAEQPSDGGTVVSPVPQQSHPCIIKLLLPHIVLQS